MPASVIQPSFAAGEISPSFWGHVDHVKFRIACATMRNMFASIRGGAYSRAGTAFVGKSRQAGPSNPPRIAPFQFKVGQSYILEFGDFYLRFIANGGYITEAPIGITAATNTDPCQLTVPMHGYANGDAVFVSGVAGMTQIDGLIFLVADATTNTFTLQDGFGSAINALNFGVYVNGTGTAARLYTVTTPYPAADLPYLKYAESADLMSLVLANATALTEYPPQDLDRLAANNWSLAATNFGSAIAAPPTCAAAASAAPSGTLPSAQYAYCATAVDAATGQESVASPIAYVSSVDIALTAGSITVTAGPVPGAASYNFYKAPAAVYVNGATAQTVPIGATFGFIGSSAGTQFVDQNVIQDFTRVPPLHLNPFARGQILDITALTGGSGYTQQTASAAIASATGSGAVILPVVVGGAVVAYIVENPGHLYKSTDTLVVSDSGGGSGATGTPVVGPQSGTYPGVVAYFQERRGYADSLNNPDAYNFSQPGAFTNFDSGDPPIDSDAISGSPWAQQVNGIQWMIPVPAGLLAYTGLDAWLLEGANGPATPFTPASQNAAAQEALGYSPTLQPIKAGYQILAWDAFSYILNALNYNYFTNTYAGDDLTILANHLFDGHSIVQWAFARKPFKIFWCVRDDGVLLSLTYLKEQEVIAWARHDTNGQVAGVAVASEPPVDAVYLVIKRFIPGATGGGGGYAYYVERMDNRLWPNAEACWCVDAGLSLAQPRPAATLTAGAASGTGVAFTASANVFDGVTLGVPGQVIRMGGGKATVTTYISPLRVIADITVPITALFPDQPAGAPAIPQPAAAGAWSIATPVNVISGLNHLEGMTVTGLADGAVITPTVVSGGAIALAAPASAVTVGLPFQAQLQSLHLQAEGEMLHDRRKKLVGVTVRLEKSRGVRLGSDQPNASAQENGASVPWGVYPYGKMSLIPEKQNLIGPNQNLPLFTGDHYIPIDGDWNQVGQSAAPGMVAAQQDYPLPMQVLAFVPKFVAGDTPAP